MLVSASLAVSKDLLNDTTQGHRFFEDTLQGVTFQLLPLVGPILWMGGIPRGSFVGIPVK